MCLQPFALIDSKSSSLNKQLFHVLECPLEVSSWPHVLAGQRLQPMACRAGHGPPLSARPMPQPQAWPAPAPSSRGFQLMMQRQPCWAWRSLSLVFSTPESLTSCSICRRSAAEGRSSGVPFQQASITSPTCIGEAQWRAARWSATQGRAAGRCATQDLQDHVGWQGAPVLGAAEAAHPGASQACTGPRPCQTGCSSQGMGSPPCASPPSWVGGSHWPPAGAAAAGGVARTRQHHCVGLRAAPPHPHSAVTHPPNPLPPYRHRQLSAPRPTR